MRADPPAEVIIVGAGPVGLSLTLGLSRMGIRATVIERKQRLDPHSRATVIFPRTLEVLQSLGVLDAFLQAGNRVPQVRLESPQDRTRIVKFDFTELIDETAVPFALAIPQNETERLLLEGLQKAGATTRFGTEALHFEQNSDGVRLKVRHDRAEEWITGRFLVGADGAHSAIRTNLGFELEGKTYGTRACLADVRLPPELDQTEFWPTLLDERGVVVGIRFGDGIFRIVEDAIENSVDEAALDTHLDRLAARLFKCKPEILWKSVYHKHERMAARFRVGNVLLVGDAAHLNSPAGGQGMNSGIQDAHNLAWKLESIVRRPDASSDDLLESYHEERREYIAREIQTFADRNEKFESAPAVIRIPLAFLLSRLGGADRSAPPMARRLAMLEQHYAGSSLVSRGDGPIGHRLPNVLTVKGDRLYQRLHGAAIVSAKSSDRLRTLAERLGICFVDIDLGRLTRFFERENYAAVVRPDHIVADVQGVDSLTEDRVRRGLGRTAMTGSSTRSSS